MKKLLFFLVIVAGMMLVSIVSAQPQTQPRAGADDWQPSCAACHEGVDRSLPKNHPAADKADDESKARIKEIFSARAESRFMDGLHGQQGVTCQECHGQTVPEIGADVENETCLSCHGTPEELAKATDKPESPDRNPHKSHMGDIGCSLCHHAHSASKSYCLECHTNFKMPISGGAE